MLSLTIKIYLIIKFIELLIEIYNYYISTINNIINIPIIDNIINIKYIPWNLNIIYDNL